MSAEMRSGDDGLCAAYGCPLLGTLGRGNEWMCFCHFDADAGAFQAITTAIRRMEPIAASTLDIHRFHCSDDWPKAYRAVQRRLIEADRRDLLRAADEGVVPWLARLEAELLGAVRELKSSPGPRYGIPMIPTAPIIGPTHAASYSPYADHDGESS